MQFSSRPFWDSFGTDTEGGPILFISLLGSAVGYFVIGFAGTPRSCIPRPIIGGITGCQHLDGSGLYCGRHVKEKPCERHGALRGGIGLGSF